MTARGGTVLYALDSTGVVWLYYSNGSTMQWAKGPGAISDIGNGGAISGGKLYEIYFNANNIPTLYAFTKSPVLAKLFGNASNPQNGAYAADSSGTIWLVPSILSGTFTKSGLTPPITPTYITGSGSNIWIANGTGAIDRYYASFTANGSSGGYSPGAYMSYSSGMTLYDLPLDGTTFGFQSNAFVDCSCVGGIFGASFTTPQLGAGYSLVLNISNPAGFDCYTVPILGTIICTFAVTESCTNTPQWAPTLVDDSPPAQAGWITPYTCGRLNSSQPWVCEPIPTAARKTADTGPEYCPFYVITP